MVLARKIRTAPSKQAVGEAEMAHGWPAAGESAGGPEPGVPRAIFTPHANSLPFEERCVSLQEPAKIGRNVYRQAPSPTNSIFECRVLSRHHATLWYEKGHFFIVDNQSSNGTFINNHRCSIGKDNEFHEVFSGDVLQFGIAVVENQPNQEKNTYLPVVALLKLYHPDGKEAKLTFNPAMTTPLHLKELYQLNNFLQEAVSREAVLEARLRTLRECVERTRAEALSGWELLVGEQRLLARVHALEATVAAGKHVPDEQLEQLVRDKADYREAAQESLRLAHEQRLALEEALERKFREAESLRHNNGTLRLTADRALAELQKLAARCERKICAAKLAIASAEEREQATRARLPLALSKMSGEARMLLTSWDGVSGERGGEPATLVEAVRALPDFIKLLLPERVLAQVGIKAISIDAKNAKECELILKKHEQSDENRDKRCSLEESVLGWLEDNCGGPDNTAPASCAVEENGTTDHDSPETTRMECEMDSTQVSDNNANSTFRPSENHTAPADSKGKRSSEGGCADMATWALALRGLRDEVAALRTRLAELHNDNEQLRRARDSLLQQDLEELSSRRQDGGSEEDSEKHDPESHKELAARLERALAAERDLATELASRPTTETYSELTLTCQKLRSELEEKDHMLERIRWLKEKGNSEESVEDNTLKRFHTKQCDVAVNTTEETDLDELTALNELDEALGEFGVDDDRTESESDPDTGPHDVDDVLREMEELVCEVEEVEKGIRESEGEEGIQKSDSFEDLRRNVEENLQEKDIGEVAVEEETDSFEVSKEKAQEDRAGNLEKEAHAVATVEASELLALQEELVRVKEHWAAAQAECARLQQGSRRHDNAQWLAYAAALAAAGLYALLYSHLS